MDQTDEYEETTQDNPDVTRHTKARSSNRYKVMEAKGNTYNDQAYPQDSKLTAQLREEVKTAVENGDKQISSVQAAADQAEDKDAYYAQAQKLAGECTWGVYNYDAECGKSFYPVGPFCIPARTYKGSCKTRQNLTTMTWEQKIAWAKKCDDTFECQPFYCSLGTDYLTVCPSGWLTRANGFCEAPEEFKPPEKYFKQNGCERLVQFGAYSSKMKERFEQKCFVKWPCKGKSCRPDYSRNCPYGWTEQQDFVCAAGSGYTGPCPRFMNTTSLLLRYDLKANVEFVCSVRWPCEVDCSKDYDQPCPIGWRHLGAGECLAPSFYKMPVNDVCRAKMAFGNLDPAIKEAFSQECKAPWPCVAPRTSCEKDYSSRCPVGWIDIGSNGFCQPPATYSGDCGARSFAALKDAAKHKLESTCNIEWPCKGENWFALEYLHTDVDKPYSQDVKDEKDNAKAAASTSTEEIPDGNYEQDFKYFLNVVKHLGFKDLDAFKLAGSQIPAQLEGIPLAKPTAVPPESGLTGNGPMRLKSGEPIVDVAPIFKDAKYETEVDEE